MTTTTTNEKLTLQVAAKAFEVSVRTVQRYLDKGLLTKVKEDGKVYVYADEVRGLRQKINTTKKMTNDKISSSKATVTVDMSYLEGLLVQLGQLKEKQQLLLEYKDDIRQKDDTILAKERELSEQRAIIEQKTQKLSEAERLLQEKDKVMQQAGAEIQKLRTEAKRAKDLEAELVRPKRPCWWKRLLSK